MNIMMKKTCVFWLGLSVFMYPFFGQQKKMIVKADEYEVKIAYIKNFFDFIKWPPENTNSNEFIFGIIGDTPLSEQIMKLSSQIKIPEKKVSVRVIADLIQVKECQALMIGHIDAEKLKEILALIGNLPILSISETEGFAEIGVLINLFKIENNVKFEINYSAVKRSGLNFSAKLFKLAKLIGYSR